MSFEQSIKIPLDRVGVLIGRDGKVKDMIEKSCGVRLDIDSEYGEVIIKGNAPIEKMEPFKAVELVTSIARGCAPDKAKRLLEEDMILQIIDLKEYAGKSRNALGRIKGRIIGSNGKARRLIEELSEAYISVHGHYVAIIGKPEEVKIAMEAVTMLARGSMHKSVYNMLQNARRRAKMERLKLWEDSI